MYKEIMLITFLVLLVPVSAFAYPTQIGVGSSARVIHLGTSDFDVDLLNGNTVSIDVKFENKKNTYEGIMWDSQQFAYPDNVEKSLDIIYNGGYDPIKDITTSGSGRYISVTIDDVTESAPVELDHKQFQISSDYNLIATTDHTDGFVDSLQLEVLDIEQNVKGSDTTPSSFEFEFELTSPEFQIGRTYEIELYTRAGGGTSKTFTLTEPIVEETPVTVIEETTPDKPVEQKPVIISEQVDATEYVVPEEKPIPATPKELGIASFVDSSKDPWSYIDRYENEASYKKWFDDNYSQYDSIYEAVGLDPNAKKPTENKVTTQPVSAPKQESKEVTCGKGMKLVDGYCQVSNQVQQKEIQCGRGMTAENGICVFNDPEPKSEGFLDSIFSMFSNLFK